MAEGATETVTSPLARGYRPWFDGVRAVGLAMVLVQHTIGTLPVDIGSIGLAAFFALSGYLITGLLLDERAADGSVSLRGFYLRRAARLVPAVVLVVVVCDLLFIIAGDLAPLPGSLAALTYTANYALILDSDFVLGFGPTWSLAVEEHFYLLWPLVLLGITRRWGLRGALWATLAICVTAMFWRGVLALLAAPINLIDIGSFERADSMLYGCAAAIAVRLGWRPRGWMFFAGVALYVLTLFATNGHAFAFAVVGSAALAIVSAAMIVCLDYAAAPWIRRALSLRVLVTLGILSYGVYLWHGPAMRLVADFGLPGPGWRGVAAVASIGIAALSHRYVEMPIRIWGRQKADAMDDRRRGTPIAELQERFMLDRPLGGVQPEGAPGQGKA
ncbi:MAG: acyltransferase [Solirubrobacterales bacterium]|nr:acyltransferase [Solirubrobacterales bacterium]